MAAQHSARCGGSFITPAGPDTPSPNPIWEREPEAEAFSIVVAPDAPRAATLIAPSTTAATAATRLAVRLRLRRLMAVSTLLEYPSPSPSATPPRGSADRGWNSPTMWFFLLVPVALLLLNGFTRSWNQAYGRRLGTRLLEVLEAHELPRR